MKIRIFLFVSILFGVSYSSTFDDLKSDIYLMDKDTVVFRVMRIRSANLNNDKVISNYIKKVRQRKSISVLDQHTISSKRGYCVIFFWKNFTGRRWGFVLARLVGPDTWKIRMNGENFWTELTLFENQSFKWFTSGRSLGVTIEADNNNAMRYLYTGDIDY